KVSRQAGYPTGHHQHMKTNEAIVTFENFEPIFDDIKHLRHMIFLYLWLIIIQVYSFSRTP
ncbi:MAG: hypothetical protein OXH47_04240, partial [Paracoccaceae bacterium]|nr:hypothetical protein [Paracoccaceae bacterium]